MLARSLGAQLLLSLSAQFETDVVGRCQRRALFVDVRTRRSVPISAAGDASASSWSVSQIDPSATLDRVSEPRNDVGWQLYTSRALANPTEQF